MNHDPAITSITPAPSVDIAAIQGAVRTILEAIGEDPDRDGLRATPQRVAEMYAELFAGLHRDAAQELSVVFEAGHDEMILVRDITLHSICEHHLIPFVGKAHVAYIPNKNGQITGLSKIARLVDIVAKKPQVQERLTTEIADAMEEALEPRGIFVMIEAEHLCMSMRGVRTPGSKTLTSAVRGLFRNNDATRAEVLALIGR